MFEDALNELQKIDSVDCDHRSARLVRLSVYADQCNWALVTSEAESLVTEFPQEVEYWIQWAYGSRQLIPSLPLEAFCSGLINCFL